MRKSCLTSESWFCTGRHPFRFSACIDRPVDIRLTYGLCHLLKINSKLIRAGHPSPALFGGMATPCALYTTVAAYDPRRFKMVACFLTSSKTLVSQLNLRRRCAENEYIRPGKACVTKDGNLKIVKHFSSNTD